MPPLVGLITMETPLRGPSSERPRDFPRFKRVTSE